MEAQMEVTISSYVIASDTGMAPCIQDDLLTLALCKPILRTSIGKRNGVGDVVAGILPGSPRGQPQYIGFLAIVKLCATPALYYAPNSVYRHRRDCIYRSGDDGELIHYGGSFHNDKSHEKNMEDQRKDKQGVVLICEVFKRYDHNDAPVAEHLKGSLKRGHQNCNDDASRKFIMGLLAKEGLLTAGEGAASGSGNNGPVADGQTDVALSGDDLDPDSDGSDGEWLYGSKARDIEVRAAAAAEEARARGSAARRGESGRGGQGGRGARVGARVAHAFSPSHKPFSA